MTSLGEEQYKLLSVFIPQTPYSPTAIDVISVADWRAICLIPPSP